MLGHGGSVIPNSVANPKLNDKKMKIWRNPVFADRASKTLPTISFDFF